MKLTLLYNESVDSKDHKFKTAVYKTDLLTQSKIINTIINTGCKCSLHKNGCDNKSRYLSNVEILVSYSIDRNNTDIFINRNDCMNIFLLRKIIGNHIFNTETIGNLIKEYISI